jgi:peptidoglycan DL-endopeptidase CwlO
MALIVALSGLVVATAIPASAAPGDSGDDGEGGSKTLIQQLEIASKGFVEAREALDRSKKKQQALTAEITKLDAELAPRQAAVDEIVQQTYRTGRLGPMSALLSADTTSGFIDRAEMLQTVAARQNTAVADLRANRDNQAAAKQAVDATIRDQQKQLDLMAKRKAQAENALKAVNAGQDDPQPTDGGSSSKATAVKRNSDGSLPAEGCTVNDPTTSGCITPRTLHALQQAKSAGFNHFVGCFRHQNSGEHPKGRACDFAADKDGFGGVATGSSKTYGTNLANYFINNSSRLGVLYVIWFRRIWLPSSGWKAYSRGNGDPSSDHTNHVHLSVR